MITFLIQGKEIRHDAGGRIKRKFKEEGNYKVASKVGQ